MQVRAICEAAADCTKRGIIVKPEIMIPLTATSANWNGSSRASNASPRPEEEKKVNFDYKFGTMIEIPRAAVTAGEIAKLAQFFSFGTNDLTQMTFGFSRDDAERNVLVTYIEQKILAKNPFQTLDRNGVGKLMQMAINDGRKTRPELEVGICGEHGGDPDFDRVVPHHRQQTMFPARPSVSDRPPGGGARALKYSGKAAAEDK